MDVGVRALPILSLITFFIGLILALQAAYEFRRFGAMIYVATAVAISMSRELGPLITAIVVIGRSGSAFAAEIGTMKVTEEIDALETMAISPVRFLVTPKFLAMIVMLPCLTIWANSMGILGGALFGVAQADFTVARYVRASVDSLFMRDIVTGLVKSVMFGITITAVGCLEGLNTGAGAEQVGKSTTRAVVMSIFMVVLVDLVFTTCCFSSAVLGIGDWPTELSQPSSSDSEVMLSLRDLRVSYGDLEILHGITLDVRRGETLVILGGSGSGKSTLLRTLVGLEKASSGEIWMKGKNIAEISDAEMDEIRKNIGMSFQGRALFGSMTVGENVALPLREHTKLENSTIEIMLRLKLEQVGLAGFEYYMPSQLSGGMKKRAAVARALAMDPEILFFDEPSAGLDPIIAAGIDQLILELKQAFRMTIIVVTHELASAYLIADRMVLIDKGNLVANGTVAEMRASTQPRVRQFLDRVPEPEVARELDYLQMLTQDRRL